MLKKMRMRVILSAVLAFFVVIALVSILVNVINYRIVTEQADRTLFFIWDIENQQKPEKPEPRPREMQPMPPFMGMSNPESGYTTRFFVVKLDEEEKVVSVDMDRIASVDQEEAELLAGQVLDKQRQKGYLKEYRFLKKKEKGYTTIILLNVMQNQQHLKMVRIITAGVAVVSLLIVSVLVVFFSRAAIKPIAKNIERQKQFITDASHELKTPLTSIMTSLDVLEMDRGADEWTDNIRGQSERMTKLVGELVTLSRLDEVRPLYQRERFSFSDLVWEMVEVYESRAKVNGKNMNVRIGYCKIRCGIAWGKDYSGLPGRKKHDHNSYFIRNFSERLKLWGKPSIMTRNI